MNKKLLILAVAGFALASCSNDEVVESAATSDANAINFRPLVNNVTRAADITTSSLTSFKATAFQTGATTTAYFSNVVFTKNDAGTYTSANKYYWPSAYNLDFYAWSPATLSDDYSSISVTPGTTIASQPDLVYGKATNWGKQTGNDGTSGVTINFRHAESKVIVKLKNTNPNLYFTVKDVKIGYLASAGTFAYSTSGETASQNDGNLSNSDWTTTGGNETDGVYQLADASSTSYNGAATQVGADMILIPQALTAATVYSAATEDAAFNGAYILVEYKAQNTNSSGAYIVGAGSGEGEYVKAIWPLTAIQWQPGFKYTYTVDLAGGGYHEKNTNDLDDDLDPILEGAEIMFATVTVDEWDEAAYTIMNVAKGSANNVSMEAASSNFIIYITGLTAGNTLTITNDNDIFSTDPTVTTSVPTGGTAVVTGTLNANTGSARTSKITVTDTTADPDVVTTITITQAGS